MNLQLPLYGKSYGDFLLRLKRVRLSLRVVLLLALFNGNLYAGNGGKIAVNCKGYFNSLPKSGDGMELINIHHVLFGNLQQNPKTVTCGVDLQDSVTGYLKSATTSQIFYLLTVTNTGSDRDSFSLSETYLTGTSVYVYIETVDGITLTQTPGIEPGGSYSFIIRFVSPKGTPSQTTNYTELFATSLACGATDSTYITTHIYGGSAPTGDSCDVGVTKTANAGTVTAGNRLTYTLNIMNSLAGVAKDVFMIDTLPSTVIYDSSYVSVIPEDKYSLTYTSSSNTVQFRYLSSLGQNQPITIIIKVRPRCTAVPSVRNRAVISTSTYDNNSSNDASSVTTVINSSLSPPIASDVVACYNSEASLTATGAGSGSGYKWYTAATDGTLLYTGQNYTTPILSNSATYYVGLYNLDTSTCVSSRAAVAISVTPAPVVGSPDDTTICPENIATFSIAASGNSLAYHWQLSSDGGSSWSSLADTGVYTGTSDSVLVISSPAYSMTGNKYRCNVTAGGCVSAVSSNAATLTVRQAYTWLGVNTDWNDAVNWCQGIPDSVSDVIIPSGLVNYPLISTSAQARNLTIETGGRVTLDSGYIQLFGTISNSGILDARSGTVQTRGCSGQSIAGSMFYNKTILNLIVSNPGPGGLNVSPASADTLKISGRLSFGNSSAQLSTGDNVNILSDSSNTASVGIVGPGNSITGKVIVDRYINTGTIGGQHPKSWEFVATPTRGATVKESWMENGASTPGYGTQVSGPGGTDHNFDSYSPNPAIKYYNDTANVWEGVSNANNSLYDTSGYMLFIRGDRTITNPFGNASPTILRQKGYLITGNFGPLDVPADGYQSIGNPYASAIDFTQVTKDAGVDDKFYAWDPYLAGSYGFGGYQTLSSVNDWEPVPGGTLPYASGSVVNTIQSGQAVFIHATSDSMIPDLGYTLTFTEACKVSGSPFSNAAPAFGNISSNDKEFFRVSLFSGPGTTVRILDGNAVVFSESFSNAIDGNDALKLMNSTENFGVQRTGRILAIEARSPVTSSDTIFYYMTNLKRQTYELRFAPSNMPFTSLQAFLLDNFLNTITPISLTDSSFIDFTVTTNAASAASNRFKIVFKEFAALPLRIVSINAAPKDDAIIVKWDVKNENDGLEYDVERSADGIHFTQLATVKAVNNGGESYSWTDNRPFAGDNYYRVRSKSQDANISYTETVKVSLKTSADGISASFNPVTNGTLHLKFNSEPAGIYTVTLFNAAGQVMLLTNIKHTPATTDEAIFTGQLAKGIYRVEVTRPTGKSTVISVMY